MYKVLFLNHQESDYGGAFLVNGLCRVLGHENVFDYPLKDSYHGKDHQYIRPWYNDEEGTTGRYEWLKEGYPEKPLDERAVKGLLNAGFFDLVVLESWRWTVQHSWNELGEAIKSSGAKVILHDGEDFSDFQRDALETVRPDFYLKRELLKRYEFSNRGEGTKILPFPFSAPDQIVEWADAQPPAEMQRDIACLLGLSYPPRQELADELIRGIEAGEFTGYVATNHDNRDPWNYTGQHPLLGFWEYLEVLRTSRFGVSMRGHGYDTCRMHETACLTGLIVDELPIQIPHPFERAVNALTYRNNAEARECAGKSSEFGEAWEEFRQKGIEHARKYHTNSARVKWLLEQVV